MACAAGSVSGSGAEAIRTSKSITSARALRPRSNARRSPSADNPTGPICHVGPGLVGNERLKTLAFWRRLLSDFDFKVEEAAYYSDFKLFTFAGATLPWRSSGLTVRRPRRIFSVTS